MTWAPTMKAMLAIAGLTLGAMIYAVLFVAFGIVFEVLEDRRRMWREARLKPPVPADGTAGSPSSPAGGAE